MQVSKRGLAAMLIIAAILGAASQYAMTAREKLTQETSKTVDSQKDIKKIIEEHRNKDGSIDKKTTIIDKSTKSSESKDSLEIVKSTPPANWMIYGGMTQQQVYSMGLQRRLIGPIFLGVYADTERHIGASLGISF